MREQQIGKASSNLISLQIRTSLSTPALSGPEALEETKV
jgi:hypothetical protein